MQCLICEKNAGTGALEFCGAAICQHCENELLVLEAGDPEYAQVVDSLCLLWRRNFILPHIHRLLESERA